MTQKISVKEHIRINPKTGRMDARIIAACDCELLGKIYSEKNGAHLDLLKYRTFYSGLLLEPDELSKLLVGAMNVNLVGPRAIDAASKVLPLSVKNARKIGGVLHLQFYVV